jgi:V/A-type H+-transporting ATPase subunit C
MSASAQAYLNTRVTAMASRLLTPEQMSELVSLSLPDLAERFDLQPLHEEQLSARAKSRAVEQALIRLLLAELKVLIRPMTPIERGLIIAWGRKFALFNLKTLIRGKLYELDQTEIGENLYDLPEDVRLHDQELFRTENVLELLRTLEQGPYRLIARQAREVYEQRREPFALEAAIDQRYYHELARLVMQFPSESLQPLRAMLGTLLDRVNLLWLLRFRFSYRLTPSETFYFLVPSFRLLSRERLLALVNIDSFEQVLQALPPPLDAMLAGSASIIEVQKRAGAFAAEQTRHLLAQGNSGIARALGYLILRERDLFMLFALIQGKLLDLPQELIAIGVEVSDPHCPTGIRSAA